MPLGNALRPSPPSRQPLMRAGEGIVDARLAQAYPRSQLDGRPTIEGVSSFWEEQEQPYVTVLEEK